MDLQGIIFEHLGDAYGWEVPFSHAHRIPLPVIVNDEAGDWHLFSSARVTGGEAYADNGVVFAIAKDGDYKGKVVQLTADGRQYRPVDLSITKDVAGLMIAALIVAAVMFSLVRYYKRKGMKAPRKGMGAVEALIGFVYDGVLKDTLGEKAPKFAGYLLTVDGSRDAASFERGAKCLNDALAAGYADEAGDIYYYLFHCYYGQKGNDASFLMKAKDALLAGIEKFPKNEKILDGLMQLYTSEDNVGDPADLVEMIDNSLAEDPNNVDLWFGRGRVFYKLQNYDETINSFKKVVELQPDLYEGNYYLGLFYTVKADAMNTEMGKKTYMSQSEYDADLKAVNAIYMEALPYFEKAHAIKPDDVDTVDFMKSIAFRLRDEPGMMDKYNEYNTLLKQLKGEA